MAGMLTAFREYLQEYAKSYLRIAEGATEFLAPDEYTASVERGLTENARFLYLQIYGWALGERYLEYYQNSAEWRSNLNVSAKIAYLLKGDFRHNDYETHAFADECLAVVLPLLPANLDLRSEPVRPEYEDCMHFIGNFIAWYKRAHGIPLRLW